MGGTYLATRDDDREAGVEEDGSDVVGVALEGLDAGLGLVVPDADLGGGWVGGWCG